jgi:hypothetical protein
MDTFDAYSFPTFKLKERKKDKKENRKNSKNKINKVIKDLTNLTDFKDIKQYNLSNVSKISNVSKTLEIVISPVRININSKLSVVYGRVQSGKRDCIFQFAIDCINGNRNCVIFTNNIRGDAMLMKESLTNILGKHDSAVHVSMITTGPKSVNDLFNKMTFNRQIVIALFNHSSIKKIKKIADDLHKEHIYTSFIFDEGDTYTNGDTVVSRRVECEKIVKKYKCVFVTATPKSLLFEIDGIKCENVYKIPIPENYVGYEDLNVYEINNNKDFSYISQFFDNYNEGPNSPNDPKNPKDPRDPTSPPGPLLSVHTFKNKKTNTNKIIGIFINTDRKVKEQKKIATECCEKYPDSFVVVNNGSQIQIYKNGKHDRNSNKSLPSTLYDIQQEWPSDGVIRYLFLIGSEKISRCTPIRAELPEKPTNCNEMLLITNMFYLPRTLYECNLVQQIRLVGIYPNPNNSQDSQRPQLNLYTTKEINNKLSLYNSGIDKILDKYYQHSDKTKDNKKDNNKEEDKKLCTNTIIDPIPKQEYVKCYKSHKAKRDNGLCYLTKESYEHAVLNGSVEVITEDVDQIIRKEWKTSNNIIGRFMRSLVYGFEEEPEEPEDRDSGSEESEGPEGREDYFKCSFTKEYLIEIATKAGSTDPEQFIFDCMKPRKQRSNGYGTILEKIQNSFRIRTELYIQIENVFIK